MGDFKACNGVPGFSPSGPVVKFPSERIDIDIGVAMPGECKRGPRQRNILCWPRDPLLKLVGDTQSQTTLFNPRQRAQQPLAVLITVSVKVGTCRDYQVGHC